MLFINTIFYTRVFKDKRLYNTTKKSLKILDKHDGATLKI